MENHQTKNTENHHETHHIVTYKEHFSTLLALILLTGVTVAVSVFGANLTSLSVATAMLIASVKVIVVAYYFMHLKYDQKIYTWLILLVSVLFVSLLVLTAIEYLNR